MEIIVLRIFIAILLLLLICIPNVISLLGSNVFTIIMLVLLPLVTIYDITSGMILLVLVCVVVGYNNATSISNLRVKHRATQKLTSDESYNAETFKDATISGNDEATSDNSVVNIFEKEKFLMTNNGFTEGYEYGNPNRLYFIDDMN